MKLGDRTTEIWCGDIVYTMEFVAKVGQGRMIFYNIDKKCFHLVYPELFEGNYVLRGWAAAGTISELLNEL